MLRVAAPIVADELRGAARLAFIREVFLHFLGKNSIQGVAIEGYSVGSVNRPFDLGEVSGVLRQTVYTATGLECVVVPPSTLKKYATGLSHASKEQMIDALRRHYATDDDNIADAVWLARYAWGLGAGWGTMMTRTAREALAASQPKKPKRKYRVTTPTNL